MGYAEDFAAANSPGRGSTVGDFVKGKKGGWVPKDHPDAAPTTPAPTTIKPPTPIPQRVPPPQTATPPAPVPQQAPPTPGGGGGVPSILPPEQQQPMMQGLEQAIRGPSEGFAASGSAGELNPRLGMRSPTQAVNVLSRMTKVY